MVVQKVMSQNTKIGNDDYNTVTRTMCTTNTGLLSIFTTITPNELNDDIIIYLITKC